MSAAWRLARPEALLVRGWDGDLAVYDDFSGDTHLLEGGAAALFEVLSESPAKHEDLIRCFLEETGESLEVVETLVADALNRLHTLGLIGRMEPVAAAS
jgi:PqqD family protein of HPr-rel-A system